MHKCKPLAFLKKFVTYLLCRDPGYRSVGIVTRLRAGRGGIRISSRVEEISVFSETSRTSLSPTQPPMRRVAGAFPLEVKRPGREANHLPLPSAEI
jgi:hypothetical protein